MLYCSHSRREKDTENQKPERSEKNKKATGKISEAK